jgi:hypothetical protein
MQFTEKNVYSEFWQKYVFLVSTGVQTVEVAKRPQRRFP